MYGAVLFVYSMQTFKYTKNMYIALYISFTTETAKSYQLSSGNVAESSFLLPETENIILSERKECTRTVMHLYSNTLG